MFFQSSGTHYRTPAKQFSIIYRQHAATAAMQRKIAGTGNYLWSPSRESSPKKLRSVFWTRKHMPFINMAVGTLYYLTSHISMATFIA